MVTRLFLSIPLALMGHAALQAQSLLVHLDNGATQSHFINDIRSIKFADAEMRVHLLNGTTASWPVTDVRSYRFDLINTSVNEHQAGGSLEIFPNPALDRITIQYVQQQNSPLSIEVVDAAGRIVASLFNGQHTGETRVEWSTADGSTAGPGMYFCRTIAGDRVMTSPIIVQ